MQIFRKACLGLLRLCGWRTSLTWPPEPRGLIMVYPHTSNWDFPLGVLFKLGHAIPAHWMGKDQMFRWPFRRLLLAIGGLPINRRERTGFVASMVEEMRRRDWLWIAVAPEGTRSYGEYLKSGFYQLALAADVPIGLGYIDYGRKQVGIDRYVRMTGNEEQDLQVLRDFYATIRPRKPADAGDIRFRDASPKEHYEWAAARGRPTMWAQGSGVRGVTATRAKPASATDDVNDANRFAFILHPLTIDYLAHHPRYRWTRHLPRALVEASAAHMPASRVGRVEGGVSPATGQRVAGFIYALGATPRQMLSRPPEFTYRRLDQAIRDAAAQGAQIVGLGAFTKVVGDAGITVARRAPIPVTTGNSLTIAATLETAKLTARRMGWPDLSHAKAMVVGATGSIGSVCSRLLAAAVHDVVLVSIEPDRLTALRQKILGDAGCPRRNRHHDDALGGRLRPDRHGDVGVRAARARRQPVQAGRVILDVALPPDISAEEAAMRPDVLVVESGEVLIPGPVDFSFDIGLPPGVAYACLAEAALLAMEGRFESFTLGRDVQPDKVKEIYRLFRKHGFQIAPLRTFGEPLSDALVAEKNARADELRRDHALLQRVKAELLRASRRFRRARKA